MRKNRQSGRTASAASDGATRTLAWGVTIAILLLTTSAPVFASGQSSARAMGMGGAAPLKPNTSPEGRVANRRVEIEVVARKPLNPENLDKSLGN